MSSGALAEYPFRNTRTFSILPFLSPETLMWEGYGVAASLPSVVIAPVFDARQVNLNVGRHGGDWPGTAPGSRGLSKGPHRLQVTAWFTTDDRSWVAAIAPDIVVQ